MRIFVRTSFARPTCADPLIICSASLSDEEIAAIDEAGAKLPEADLELGLEDDLQEDDLQPKPSNALGSNFWFKMFLIFCLYLYGVYRFIMIVQRIPSSS